MKILLVTEKCSQNEAERDGGARLVDSLIHAFGSSLEIMQFGPEASPLATWYFEYPFVLPNRFERRVANARFIAEQIQAVEKNYTHLIFVHVSMQFGLIDLPLRHNLQIWTFPMFLTPSYLASGEVVPESYIEMERLALARSQLILSPSHLEKNQLINSYSIPNKKIHVVPRGINMRFLSPKKRFLSGPPLLCSIGSVKPQKNTLGLLRLFAKVHTRFPGSKLRVIGPVQNSEYYRDVCTEMQSLGISDNVEFTGYIPPDRLSETIQDAHIHLSASVCETFGRSIFETLASGLPNIARKKENAAAEFLSDKPYVQFVDDDAEAINVLEKMLNCLEPLSSMAMEIGELYDDSLLSQLMIAKICSRDSIAISDFDGTLFHKHDAKKTTQCIEAFRKFPKRILCSARSINDLLQQLRLHHLEVDWIIGFGGSMVTNGRGKPLWSTPLNMQDVTVIEQLAPNSKRIELEDEVLQVELSAEYAPELLGVRKEIYQNTAFISHWQASKLRAAHRLLRHINWEGQIHAFGDGPYDGELLTYFDGTWVSEQNKEIEYV